MLKIENLHASVDGNEILKGVNLTVGTGEIHAIMGPNGSGKSTLAQILAGHEAYEATGGTVTYEGKDLLGLGPEERAREGVFLAFQYPVEIPGVNSAYFLRTGLNEIRKHHGEEEVDAFSGSEFPPPVLSIYPVGSPTLLRLSAQILKLVQFTISVSADDHD